MNKLTLFLFLSIVLAGCASQPATKDVAVKSIEGSEHSYVESEKIDRFLVKNPEAFKQFTKAIVYPTQFDKLKISAEADKKLIDSWNGSSWNEMDKICQNLDDFAKKMFREGGEFIPVTRGGDDVLGIQFNLISFMPYSKRYKNSGGDTVGSESNYSGIGQVTVRGILANAKTGELVAVIEDTLEVNARTSSAGNVSMMQDGNNKAAQNLAWRSTFRRFLDNLHVELTTLKHARIEHQP